MNRVGHLRVYENVNDDIVIFDKMQGVGVCFDESLSEKLCAAIIKTAKEMRNRE